MSDDALGDFVPDDVLEATFAAPSDDEGMHVPPVSGALPDFLEAAVNDPPRFRVSGMSATVDNPAYTDAQQQREHLLAEAYQARQHRSRYEVWLATLQNTWHSQIIHEPPQSVQEEQLRRQLQVVSNNGTISHPPFDFVSSVNDAYETFLETTRNAHAVLLALTLVRKGVLAVLHVPSIDAYVRQVHPGYADGVTAAVKEERTALQNSISEEWNALTLTLQNVTAQNDVSRDNVATTLRNSVRASILGVALTDVMGDNTDDVVNNIVDASLTGVERILELFERAADEDDYSDLPLTRNSLEVAFRRWADLVALDMFTNGTNHDSPFSADEPRLQQYARIVHAFPILAYETWLQEWTRDSGRTNDDTVVGRLQSYVRRMLRDTDGSVYPEVRHRSDRLVDFATYAVAYTSALDRATELYAVRSGFQDAFATSPRDVPRSVAYAQYGLTLDDARVLSDNVRHLYAAKLALSHQELHLLELERRLDALDKALKVPLCIERDSYSKDGASVTVTLSAANATAETVLNNRDKVTFTLHYVHGPTHTDIATVVRTNDAPLDATFSVVQPPYTDGRGAGTYTVRVTIETQDDASYTVHSDSATVRIYATCRRDGARFEFSENNRNAHRPECVWIMPPADRQRLMKLNDETLEFVARQLLDSPTYSQKVAYDATRDDSVVDEQLRPLVTSLELSQLKHLGMDTALASAYTWSGIVARLNASLLKTSSRVLQSLLNFTDPHQPLLSVLRWLGTSFPPPVQNVLRDFANGEATENADEQATAAHMLARPTSTVSYLDAFRTGIVRSRTLDGLAVLATIAFLYEYEGAAPLRALLTQSDMRFLPTLRYRLEAAVAQQGLRERSHAMTPNIPALSTSEVHMLLGPTILHDEDGMHRLEERVLEASDQVHRSVSQREYTADDRLFMQLNTPCRREVRFFQDKPAVIESLPERTLHGRDLVRRAMLPAMDWLDTHSHSTLQPRLSSYAFADNPTDDTKAPHIAWTRGSRRLHTRFDLNALAATIDDRVRSYNASADTVSVDRVSATLRAREADVSKLITCLNALSLFARPQQRDEGDVSTTVLLKQIERVNV